MRNDEPWSLIETGLQPEFEFDFFPDGTETQRTAVLHFIQRVVDVVGYPAVIRSESGHADDGELVIAPRQSGGGR